MNILRFLKTPLLSLLAALLWPATGSAQLQFHFDDNPLRKLQMAEIAISKFYVDSVDETKLVEDAIRGMLEKLDPHSSYTDAKETKAMTEPLQGDFEGIGVQFNMVEDTLVVIQPTVNGPSEKEDLPGVYECRRLPAAQRHEEPRARPSGQRRRLS